MTGTDAVAKAAPDGSTIGISIGGPLALNTLLFAKMPYDPAQGPRAGHAADQPAERARGRAAAGGLHAARISVLAMNKTTGRVLMPAAATSHTFKNS